MLHALHGLQGRLASKQQLANEAIHLEQNILQENVGCQDQIMAAHGGFCRINFTGNDYNVAPVILPAERSAYFQDHLMLFFTGLSRTASEIAKKQVETTKNKKSELRAMYQMVAEGINILNSNGDLAAFGKLLHESWKIKRSLTDKISNPYIDDLYTAALEAGALGGKLLGAGGGGFMLVFAKPELHPRIRECLGVQLHVPFQFESMGTQTLFYEPHTPISSLDIKKALL
jgi:D-glycero-alpha-D-manno-heptose-7-phosphate kinase